MDTEYFFDVRRIKIAIVYQKLTLGMSGEVSGEEMGKIGHICNYQIIYRISQL